VGVVEGAGIGSGRVGIVVVVGRGMFGLLDQGSTVGLQLQGSIVGGMDMVVGQRRPDTKSSRRIVT